MVNLEKVNEELQAINENLFIKSTVEDYCEQDMEEYGIQDIEETRHLSLRFWRIKGIQATIIKEYFDFDTPFSLVFSQEQRKTMEYLGIDNETINKVTSLLWKNQK